MPPSEINWTAIGVVGGLIINVTGWFVVHFLAKRREAERENRIRNEDEIAQTERNYISANERDILRQCVSAEGFEKGKAWIIYVDAFGSWVRAGKHDFMDDSDSSFQARYLTAFETLYGREYFRLEGKDFYCMTGLGYERAELEA